MNGMNAMSYGVKKINGKLYRVNEIIQKTFEQVEKVANENKIREYKLVNLTNQIYNNDDATSEEDYSQNISFLSDDSDNESSMYEESDKIDFADVDNLISYNNNDNLVRTSSDNNLTRAKSFNIKWTHFISIPLYLNKEFIEKFEYFKSKITEENDINIDLFQKSNRLHMTLCLLKIDNKKDIQLLDKVMKELDESIKKILDGGALYIDFDQLEIMGTPHKSRVLYTKPSITTSDKYKDIVDLLINKLIESNLMTEEMKSGSHIYFSQMSQRYENEKPHVTLLNSTFLRRKDNSITNTYFNGLKLIKRMNNFSFGVHKIEELHVNEMRIDYKTDMYQIHSKYKLI
jgi:hypothetical protein